ncbi:hypothetical protein, partial [Aquipuribacter hungaricus]
MRHRHGRELGPGAQRADVVPGGRGVPGGAHDREREGVLGGDEPGGAARPRQQLGDRAHHGRACSAPAVGRRRTRAQQPGPCRQVDPGAV